MQDLSNALTPDPVELQRRIDEDATVSYLIERIERLEEESRVRKTTGSLEAAPIRKENHELSKQRATLLHEIRRNDAKIRSITEKARVAPQGLEIAKRKLKGRKVVIRDRLVKQMLCRAREEIHQGLKEQLRSGASAATQHTATPVPPVPPEPPTPTEPTTSP